MWQNENDTKRRWEVKSKKNYVRSTLKHVHDGIALNEKRTLSMCVLK